VYASEDEPTPPWLNSGKVTETETSRPLPLFLIMLLHAVPFWAALLFDGVVSRGKTN
jgi:hypothetical protein